MDEKQSTPPPPPAGQGHLARIETPRRKRKPTPEAGKFRSPIRATGGNLIDLTGEEKILTQATPVITAQKGHISYTFIRQIYHSVVHAHQWNMFSAKLTIRALIPAPTFCVQSMAAYKRYLDRRGCTIPPLNVLRDHAVPFMRNRLEAIIYSRKMRELGDLIKAYRRAYFTHHHCMIEKVCSKTRNVRGNRRKRPRSMKKRISLALGPKANYAYLKPIIKGNAPATQKPTTTNASIPGFDPSAMAVMFQQCAAYMTTAAAPQTTTAEQRAAVLRPIIAAMTEIQVTTDRMGAHIEQAKQLHGKILAQLRDLQKKLSQ